MKKLRFKPRATFNADLKRLASLDKSIIDEVRAAIDLLLEQQQLPPEFEDHELNCQGQFKNVGFRQKEM